MIPPKALEKELNYDLFLGPNVILVYSRCIKILAPIAVESELSFQGLLKRSHGQCPEDLEVDGFKIMKGLLIKEEHLHIGMGPEGQLTRG